MQLISPILYGPSLQLDSRYQHQWFLADAQSLRMLNAEDCKGLQALELSVSLGDLQLRAPGMLRLELLLDVIEDDDEYRCLATDAQGNKIAAINEGQLPAVWFEQLVGRPCVLFKRDPGRPE